MGLIYMRISPSNGIYIGKTILTEKHRWQLHCNGAYNPNSTDYNCILSKAIRKYGKDNFSVRILEDNIPEDILNDREKFWINKYNTFYKDNPHGYNMTRGGEGHLKFLDNELLQLWNEGYTLKEIGSILNGTSYYLGLKLINLGVDKSLFTIRAKAKSGLDAMKNNPQNQKIYLLWQQGLTLTEIRARLNCDIHSAAIMLKKLYNVSEEEIQKRKNLFNSNSKKKPIMQLDMNDILIKEWASATDAAKALNLDISTIRKCIKGTRKSTGGFKWKEKVI